MKSSTLFECGPLPPRSILCPPDISYVIGVPRPPSFFTVLPLPCIILMQAEKQTKKARGRPGNKASIIICCMSHCQRRLGASN